MPQPLLSFAASPAAVPLDRSAAASASERGRVTSQQVADMLGISRVELIRSRRLPLDRTLFVQTDDAAPASVQATVLTVQPDTITPSGLTFRHRRPFPIRRLLVEIAPPNDSSAGGCGGRFHATVIGHDVQPDGQCLTAVRFTSVADGEG